MSRFIGIDYSTTSTGIAIVDGDHWQTLTLRSKPTGDTLADYYDRITNLAADIRAAIDFRKWDVLAIEGIAFAGRGSSVDRLHYAWHRTAEYLVRSAAEPLIITTNQVKQLATGKGNAQKDEVLLATERRLPQAQASNNDEADAVWIAVGASILAGSPVIDLPAAHMPKAWTKGKTA
ncbi:crossover junction endodeoxyribonuclease RuvC [uncultured Microbacterium sp.]|uniref:crossover junction endodeoxyribonuclease RuvC n=1 Tax=uncultured Microbacterium sp. TaxID=191216 RepID=UPI0025FD9C49|nr:crossover junction endodeoxyribonuclease RuvC [uncultured Microbacterium sp.]